jgi:nucleotide-binding universal stress UspA family protein
MNRTIVVGVEDSEHSKDAIAFAGRLAGHSAGRVVVVCAYPSHERGSSDVRREAQQIAQRMSCHLEGIDAVRIRARALAASSLIDALHDLVQTEAAAMLVVGSSGVGQLGEVVSHGAGARLLHAAPCAVAVVPDGYRARPSQPIRRIGVAFDGTLESRAAVVAAVAAVHAFGAELEVLTVLPARIFATPTMMGGPGYVNLETDCGRQARGQLDVLVADLVPEVVAVGTILGGPPAYRLAVRSKRLDLLVVGSRGYGVTRAALARGVSGRVVRDARCPVIAVPRGAEASVGEFFGVPATP